jgi:hypothetical protein
MSDDEHLLETLGADPDVGPLLDALRNDAPDPALEARIVGRVAAPSARRMRLGIAGGALVGLAVLGAFLALRTTSPPPTLEAATPLDPPPEPSSVAPPSPEPARAEPASTPAPPPPAPRPAPARPALEVRADRVARRPPEDELLLEARAVAERDPRRAARLLEQHARLYPRGALTQEREALRVDVLLASGQLEPARAALDRFEREYPGSPHAARLRRRVASSTTDDDLEEHR